MTKYQFNEIMTRKEMNDRGLGMMLYGMVDEDDDDEILFVRWTPHSRGQDMSIQPLDDLLELLDKLEEMFE